MQQTTIITLPKRGRPRTKSVDSSDSSSDSDTKYTKDTPIFTSSIDIDEDQIQITNVHIRVQQRRASSYITTASGLSSRLDHKLILKALKRTLHCNGSITKDPEHGPVIQLSGDQREALKTFLVDEGICEKNQIIMHGF
ncbi:hypothetical protein D5b_00018 [Faustovirus]|nr:hypothetical protein D5b_00018 [Faustovirus]AMN84891.1 hypothetical protein D6_00492 [Faustovirus]AMP43978.1 hypothetical protein PRJ_Dakar_00018 [Faustovirus]